MKTRPSFRRRLFPHPIVISLAPNASALDTRLALKLLSAPGKWREGAAPQALEQRVASYIGVEHAFALDSGRSGLYLALKALGIGPGDEVLLQAYTCIAVPNSIIWCGAKPRYVDINPVTLNMDPGEVEAQVSPHTRAIIVQHTFGHPAPLDEITALARKHGLKVIEDCAHALGTIYHGQRVGSFGDAAIFSFGRDKVISSVSGGMVVTSDPTLAQKLRNWHDQLPYPSSQWVFQQLFHPIATAGILPWYDVAKIGKAALVGFQKTGLLNLAVTREEKKGRQPAGTPARLPAAIAALALSQLSRLEAFNEHRRRLADLYTTRLAGSGIGLPPVEENSGSIFLRYTLQYPAPKRLHQAARKQHIYLGNWYDSPISPRDADLAAVHYNSGACPAAEKAAEGSVNLPTHPRVTPGEAETVADLVLQTYQAR